MRRPAPPVSPASARPVSGTQHLISLFLSSPPCLAAQGHQLFPHLRFVSICDYCEFTTRSMTWAVTCALGFTLSAIAVQPASRVKNPNRSPHSAIAVQPASRVRNLTRALISCLSVTRFLACHAACRAVCRRGLDPRALLAAGREQIAVARHAATMAVSARHALLVQRNQRGTHQTSAQQCSHCITTPQGESAWHPSTEALTLSLLHSLTCTLRLLVGLCRIRAAGGLRHHCLGQCMD